MLIDVQKFVIVESPFWEELESILNKMEANPDHRLDLIHMKRFHYLYERASADLARITTFASEKEIRRYLESLVARAYGEIHENRERQHRIRPLHWFFTTFPETFRRHNRAFLLSLGITIVGFIFGGAAVSFDQNAKRILLPFSHLQLDPSERVEQEEKAKEDRLEGQKTTFSAVLMTHNTRVSIFTLALGMTWGIGTVILLFYNGVILGGVALDYILDGQARFLLGWLMPHGVIEIPAILIAGQAGLVLAHALIGWGNRTAFKSRLRQIAPDLVTLMLGLAILLIWAGFIESFLSQYHEPVIPYSLKIGFGAVELILLILLLSRSGEKLVRRFRNGP
jgi:uncharacterized membrane protein SpoIIM required for sporulation